MPRLAHATALLGALALAACTTGTSSNEGPDDTDGTVFIWLAADKDTYSQCGAAGPPCPTNTTSYGTAGFVAIAYNGLEVRQGYVHFGLPNLPEGAELEEAYFEMYYAGRNEDGQTDDVLIPVGRAAGPWSPATLSRSNQPNTSLIGGEYTINLNPQSWSGTTNLADIVRAWYADPATNYGFHIYWNTLSPGIQKGFYSNNDIRRTVSDLGLSPRLLLKVRLAEGQTVSDITLPPLPSDNDLPFDGSTVLMARTSGGTDWPSSWNVRRGL